ncbi:ribosomal protection-like ABC-F family protein [uncultured Rothia sp.]|uniref:ribosomal protection-like ABC-F family protein n=1 Tax=uncultured Rothia sp. TaxID=316088 RepID=UPI00262A7D62|nr:ABC-F family ATP-binding cassette domain-containing protein [uncultured Rothia sp.]
MSDFIVEKLSKSVGDKTVFKDISFIIHDLDRIGLIGVNGTGKTTLLDVLSGVSGFDGDVSPFSAKNDYQIGYLTQDPDFDDSKTVLDTVLSSDLKEIQLIREYELIMLNYSEDKQARLERVMAEMDSLQAWEIESQVKTVLCKLGIQDLSTPVGELSGGLRRRVQLAQVLLGNHDLLLLDEPTNHLDADSILWLRDFLKNFSGGLMVISHDVELMELVVNRVFYLDANRCLIDQYNMGWKNYLTQREQDEHRRKRERANAQKKANALMEQANKMRAKATKAVAAQQMIKRAEKLLRGLEDERQIDKVAAIRFPDPAPCGKTPLSAQGLSKSYGSLEIFTDVDLAIDRGSRVVVLGLNGAGKTTLLRMLAGSTEPDTGEVVYGHGAKLGYFAQEHEILDGDRTVFENMKSAAPDLDDTRVRTILGSFLFSGDDVDKPAGVLSGGEKTRLSLATLVASSANVLLLDEPTNNLDPASREEILNALKAYQGSIVMVSHDEGAVEALDPERVLLLPDAVEDLWSKDYQDLISLA